MIVAMITETASGNRNQQVASAALLFPAALASARPAAAAMATTITKV